MPARFEARLNRFLVRARLAGGPPVEAHLADPGRLRELLRPGAELRLRPAGSGGMRRTRYTVALVRAPGPAAPWVAVEAAGANRLALRLLERRRVHGLRDAVAVRREVRHGRSRFDFLVERRRRPPVLVEVKSVSLVEDGVARFPDAPTERGRRHVEELAQVAGRGGGAAVLFIVQRPDARMVTPHRGIDPAFAAALEGAAAAGVLIRAARFRLRPDGRAEHLGAIPVRLGRRASRPALDTTPEPSPTMVGPHAGVAP